MANYVFPFLLPVFSALYHQLSATAILSPIICSSPCNFCYLYSWLDRHGPAYNIQTNFDKCHNIVVEPTISPTASIHLASFFTLFVFIFIFVVFAHYSSLELVPTHRAVEIKINSQTSPLNFFVSRQAHTMNERKLQNRQNSEANTHTFNECT